MPLGPTLLVVGGSIQATKRYRIQLWLGWVLIMLASGTLSTVGAETPLARVIGLSVLEGVGMGILYASTYFPVLAPLPVSENAHALAFFSFCRSFALVNGPLDRFSGPVSESLSVRSGASQLGQLCCRPS